MNDWARRMALGAGIPLAIVAAGLVPYLAFRSNLPDRVASHYGISGRPDGSMTPEQLILVVGVMMVLGLGMCVVVALGRRRFQPMVAPAMSFIGMFIAGLAAGILAMTAIGQRGLERWQDATLSPWALILWLGGSVAAGAAAARIASTLPSDDPDDAGDIPPALDLAPGERIFWTSTLSARWPLMLGVVNLVFALVVTGLAEPWIGMFLLLAAIAVTTFSRIRVTADHTGLTVRYGFLGRPRTRVSIHRIATAQAIEVRPAEWGGWGYRGNLALMNRAAVVLRAGPGIRLDLHDGKVFVVTIDNPETPAQLLNAETFRLEESRNHA